MKHLISIQLLILLSLFAISAAYSQEKAKHIDTFSWGGGDEALMRINNWNHELQATPNSKIYVIIYGGKISKRGEIDAHIKGMKGGFEFSATDQSKYTFVKGGFREKLQMDIWLVPQNACPPLSTPTVDFEKVIFKGYQGRLIPYWCC